MAVYTVHQAKTQLSRLLAEASQGEEVIIARGATPVARLTPLPTQHSPRTPGLLKGLIGVDDRFLDPLPDAELSAWEGEVDQPA